MKSVLTLLLSFMIISCASLNNKEDENKLIGQGVEDISSQDIDSDNKGSDSGSIDGLSTVYFEYDSSVLSEDTRDTLMGNMNWIQNHPEVASLELEGHCDPLGSEAYNIGLGRRRAESVKSFLIEKGVDPSRLSIISYGEERPISDIDNSKNRRVNFVPMY